jgi:hypothetical protein
MSSDIFALSVSEISRQESPYIIVARALRYVDKGLSSAISEMNSYRDLRKSSGKSRRHALCRETLLRLEGEQA